MEKQQHYKMVPYDASASVPMVILDGRPGRRLASPRVIDTPTQLIDLFPTILELAAVPHDATPVHDGFSLLPLMRTAAPAAAVPVDGARGAPVGAPADAASHDARDARAQLGRRRQAGRERGPRLGGREEDR